MINMDLAIKRGLSQEAIVEIGQLHDARDALHKSITDIYLTKNPENRKLVYQIAQILPKIEERLQVLWGFDVDTRRYRYWYVPCCRCPKSDNGDRYATGYNIINKECWLHSKGE